MIDHQSELNKALHYIAIILDNNELVKAQLPRIYNWHQSYADDVIPFTWLSPKQVAKYEDFEALYRKAPSEAFKIANRFVEIVQQVLIETELNAISNNVTDEKLTVFQQLFDLSDQEKTLLDILFCYQTNTFFEEFVDHIYKNKFTHKIITKLCCDGLKTTPKIINQLTTTDSKLARLHLIHFRGFDNQIECSYFCLNLLNYEFSNPEELKKVLPQAVDKSDLTWCDFEYIGYIQLIKNLFNNLKQTKQSGINILLHGEVGTGKTEFAKVLCQETGFQLYEIEGDEPLFNRFNRSNQFFDTLSHIQHLFANDCNSCILIDNADDVLNQTENQYSKLAINKTLESNPTPVIWIINDISLVDHAHLRRFSYVIELPKPDASIRQKIWQKTLAKYGFDIAEPALKNLAKNYSLSPALIESAAKTTWQSNGNIDEIELYIELQMKVFRLACDK